MYLFHNFTKNIVITTTDNCSVLIAAMIPNAIFGPHLTLVDTFVKVIKCMNKKSHRFKT